MRKLCWILASILLLSGCTMQSAMETIADIDDVQVISKIKKVEIELPEKASVPTMQSDDGSCLYLCDDYTVVVQTLDGGDLDATLRHLTGFFRNDLTVMETDLGATKQYNCVWSAAGEGGDYVGRALVLDDGSYHYAVSVMAEFSKAGYLSAKWKELFESVKLTDTD